MIALPNVDGKIWNLEYRVIDMIAEIRDTGKLVVSTNGEGPCAQTIGLYSILDRVCEHTGIAKNMVTIVTNNQLEQHPEYVINKSAPLYIESAQQFARGFATKEKAFRGDFRHFGLFVGRSNWLRLYLASYLNTNHKFQTQLTFHYDPKTDFHRDHLGCDDLNKFYPDHYASLQPEKLLARAPIIDHTVDEYPILTPAHFNIGKFYHKFFVEIVCETYSQGQTFYPTEKIWRPIIMRTPFIVQGPQDYMANLKRMGFKTFSRWWNESHSQDNYIYQPAAICQTIDRLSKLTLAELEGLQIDMQDTLEHNYQVMMELSEEKLLKVFK